MNTPFYVLNFLECDCLYKIHNLENSILELPFFFLHVVYIQQQHSVDEVQLV